MTRVPLLVLLALIAASFSSNASASCGDSGDLIRITAARERIIVHGTHVWPGWTAPPPVLLASGEDDCLIAHPDPPDGFEPVEADLSRAPGHLLPALAATAWPVNDVWSVAVPARADLQEFLDQYLGPGAITLDAYMYERAIMHEAFHAFQMTALGGPEGLPDFAPRGEETGGEGQGAEELFSQETLQNTVGIDVALREQGRALTAALQARTAGDAAAAAARFLDLRDGWRDRAPPGTQALEQQLEWLEGTARYADVLLALYPPAYQDTAADAGWVDLLDQLADPAGIPSGLRDGYAALGAAQAFTLDRVYPGWKLRAIPGGMSLEDLLRVAVAGRARVP